MTFYEHIFLARQDISAAQVEEVTNTLKGILEENGATVSRQEYWGLKSLPYRIKKNRKAHYSLMNISGPHAAVAEMERQMAINEDILRHMTVKVDELDENPSAMMQKREDRFGGDRGGPGGNRRPRF